MEVTVDGNVPIVDMSKLDEDPLLIVHSDCVEAMASMPRDSVDAVVCDPPY